MKKPASLVSIVALLAALAACSSGDDSVSISNTDLPSGGVVSPGTGIAGTVKDAAGTPLEGCYINKGGGTEEGILTADDGTFSANQTPGTYTVTAGCWFGDQETTDPVEVSQSDVEVKDGEVTQVDFTFKETLN